MVDKKWGIGSLSVHVKGTEYVVAKSASSTHWLSGLVLSYLPFLLRIAEVLSTEPHITGF